MSSNTLLSTLKSPVNPSQNNLPDIIQCDYQATGEKFLESHFMVIHGEW